LRAQKHVVLHCEDAAEFRALEAALIEELAPAGALQSVLAQRVVAATWRLARADQLEAQLFAENQLAGRSLGLALIRDCNGARSFDTLLRYRGGTLAELWRALRLLKALQAEAAPVGQTPREATHDLPLLAPHDPVIARAQPIEPKGAGNPGELPAPAVAQPAADLADPRTTAADPAAEENRRDSREPLPGENPIEPEACGNPHEIVALRAVAGSKVESTTGGRDAEPAGTLDAPPQRCDPTATPGHAGPNRPCGGPEGERERAARGRPVTLR
jgi:hypothetical protein